jgi:1,2-diacylglycerol 3-beta-galactosyltransferase
MNPQPAKKRTILLLYTDTGGTHRNAAEAIKEAVAIEYPETCTVECIDVWQYSPFPFNWLPRIVHLIRERKNMGRLSVRNNQNPRWKRIFNRLSRPYLRRMVGRLLEQHPNDLTVAVHPLTASPIIDAMDGQFANPFVILVTELATKNAFWFDDRADLTILPTEQSRKNALKAGVPWAKTRLLGVPVGMHYCVTLESISALRARLGLRNDKRVILLAGGKSGAGPLRATAEAIDEGLQDIQLVVVTGTNETLKNQLKQVLWRNDVIVLGYVEKLWDWMWAADMLVSKAGTGMLAEALSVGLPMILFHRVPFLEDENVTYLVNEGAALWAPTPLTVVNALSRWLRSFLELEAAAEASRRLAQPQAARLLAEGLIQLAQGQFPLDEE